MVCETSTALTLSSPVQTTCTSCLELRWECLCSAAQLSQNIQSFTNTLLYSHIPNQDIQLNSLSRSFNLLLTNRTDLRTPAFHSWNLNVQCTFRRTQVFQSSVSLFYNFYPLCWQDQTTQDYWQAVRRGERAN